ncbi:MAG: hypothetical protein Q4A55_00885 [Aerococcus sp.]|nr:hypothetical protein [Aerococcus sp.]
MIEMATYASILGDVYLEATDKGLVGVWMDGQSHAKALLASETAITSPKFLTDRTVDPSEVLAVTKQWLDQYFSGKIPEFTPPLHLVGTAFRQMV